MSHQRSRFGPLSKKWLKTLFKLDRKKLAFDWWWSWSLIEIFAMCKVWIKLDTPLECYNAPARYTAKRTSFQSHPKYNDKFIKIIKLDSPFIILMICPLELPYQKSRHCSCNYYYVKVGESCNYCTNTHLEVENIF